MHWPAFKPKPESHKRLAPNFQNFQCFFFPTTIARRVPANCPAPSNSALAKETETTERMSVTVAGDGFHSDVVVADAEGHAVTLAEPVEDGGSGKGPNPMEALISSFAICEFEQSLVIAKEKGVRNW